MKSFRKNGTDCEQLIDTQGALKIFGTDREFGANIVQIGYDRTSTDLEYGDAHVSVA